MKTWSRQELSVEGFEGFTPITELRSALKTVPREQGVYLVLSNEGFIPEFLKVGTGGYYKGRDPNVSTAKLSANWVANAQVLNIGKAGGAGIKSTLRNRIRAYLRFGEGKSVGYHGGRYIWQLKNSSDLMMCWMVTKSEPRTVEQELIHEFQIQYGVRPFANPI